MNHNSLIRISPDAWKVLQHTKAEQRGSLGALASRAIMEAYGELKVTVPARMLKPVNRTKKRLPIRRKR